MLRRLSKYCGEAGAGNVSISRLFTFNMGLTSCEIGCHFVMSFYIVSVRFHALCVECRVNQVQIQLSLSSFVFHRH